MPGEGPIQTHALGDHKILSSERKDSIGKSEREMPHKVILEQDSSLYSIDLDEEECGLPQIDECPAVSLNCKWLA